MAGWSCSLEHSGAWAYTSLIAGFRTSKVAAVGAACPSMVIVKSGTASPFCELSGNLGRGERQRSFDGRHRVVDAENGVYRLPPDRQLPRLDADDRAAWPQRQRDLRP